MNLPDFTEFEPFNQLRRSMGTDALGYFELFDPRLHLTGQERSDLDRRSINVPNGALHRLLDFTLVYKNSRVIVFDKEYFHLCRCSSFPLSSQAFSVATSLSSANSNVSVCRDCLQTLHYQGYDALKARKEQYSHHVFENFQLNKFWTQYPMYPISENREKRRKLED